MGKTMTLPDGTAITHAQNDARYVAQGRELALDKSLTLDNPNTKKDLRKMNRKKNGHPFVYSDTLFVGLALLRTVCSLSYRVLQGMAEEELGKCNIPHFTVIRRRILALDMGSHEIRLKKRDSNTIWILVDGSGLEPFARGEFIRAKHGVRRGFIRFTALIDHDTLKIIGYEITDERTGEASNLETTLETALKKIGIAMQESETNTTDKPELESQELAEPKSQEPQGAPAAKSQDKSKSESQELAEPKSQEPQGAPAAKSQGKPELESQELAEPKSQDKPKPDPQDRPEITLFGDGLYSNNKIHAICEQLGVNLVSPVPSNATAKVRGKKGGHKRKQAVLDQLGGGVSAREFAAMTDEQRKENKKAWKKRVNYGRRWLIEIFFSSFKSVFGSSVQAVKMDNIVKEISFNVWAYNKLIDVAREAMA